MFLPPPMAATTIWTSAACLGGNNHITSFPQNPFRTRNFLNTNTLHSSSYMTSTLTMCCIFLCYSIWIWSNWASSNMNLFIFLFLHFLISSSLNQNGYFLIMIMLLSLSLPPLLRQRPWHCAIFACFVMITSIHRFRFLWIWSSFLNFFFFLNLIIPPSDTSLPPIWVPWQWLHGWTSNKLWEQYVFGSLFFIDLPPFLLPVTCPSYVLFIIPLGNWNPLAGSIPFKVISIFSDALGLDMNLWQICSAYC